MTYKNPLQQIREEREREEQEIKEMHEFYNSRIKINAKLSHIKTIKDSLSDLRIYKRYE